MMRFIISRTAVFLVAALAVAACGSQLAAPPVTPHVTPSTAGQNGPAAFVARAQQVTAQWDRSDAARAWRTGLVLMDASDLTPVPSKGFSSGREKLAFMSGHFRLAGVLPAGPLPGMVRWANGTTLRLPLLSARAAFAELAAERPCAVPNACGQLTVTGAEPGVVTVRTSRGPASVPAWRFTVAGLGWKVSEVAVARSAFVVLPGYGQIPPPGRDTRGVSELTAVSGNGRALRLIFTGGACTTAWGAYKYESGSTVVVGSWERSSANGPCPAVGIGRTARVTLARPLGTRVVLDVASGLPLVPGLSIP
ncbi:MAG: hypothetical protein WAL12_00315 [Trebonia sp.]